MTLLSSSPSSSIDEYWMVLVDAASYVSVAAGAEDWGGAGVGVDAGEVVRREGKGAVGVGDGFGRVMQEEGAAGLGELSLQCRRRSGRRT